MTDMLIQEYKEYFLTHVHEPGRTIVAKLLRNLEFYDKNKLNQYLMLLSNVKDTKFTTMYKDDLTNPSFVERVRDDMNELKDKPDDYFFEILDGLSEVSPDKIMLREYKEYFLGRTDTRERMIVASLLRNLENYNKNKFNRYLSLLYEVKDTTFTTMYKDELTDSSFVEKLREGMDDFKNARDNYFFGILNELSEISPARLRGGGKRRGKRSTKRNRTKSRKSRKSRNRH